MKKVDGLYWDENPDWQHDKWQFKELLKEIKIFQKMANDRDWICGLAKDLQEVASTLENKDDIPSAICEIELRRDAIYYYKIAKNMYEMKTKEQA